MPTTDPNTSSRTTNPTTATSNPGAGAPGTGAATGSPFGDTESGQTGSRQTGSRESSQRTDRSSSERDRSGNGGERGARPRTSADGLPNPDRLLDELLPDQVEWETLVRRYPKPALLAAAGLGFYVAVKRGPALMAAFSGFAAQEMSRRVNDFLGTEVV